MSAVRRLAGGLLLALAILGWGAGAAWAYWTTSGTGTGTATTATLNPPTGVTASATPGSGTILVAWTTPSGDLAPQGYVVRRSLGSSTVVVCGSPTPVTDTSCTDQPVLAGTYTYTVTAVYNSWTATSAGVEITPDRTAPRVIGVASATANGAYRAGDEILVEVAFSETVTVGGTPQLDLRTSPTGTTAASYVSGSGTSVLTFRYTVAAGDTSIDLDYASTSSLTGTIRDDFGNPATLGLPTPGAVGSLGANANLVIDTTAPDVTAPAVPTQATSLAVSIALGTATDTGGSGVVPSSRELQRAVQDLTNNACTGSLTFTTIATITPSATTMLDTDVASGSCYQYRQRATDVAGNVGTSAPSGVVKVDSSAPTPPSLTLTRGSTSTFATGATLWFRTTATSGSFSVAATATDPETGVNQYDFPTLPGPWSSGSPGTYAWSSGAASGGTFPVTARNGFNVPSAPSTFTVVADGSAPVVNPPSVPALVSAASVPLTLGTASDADSGVSGSPAEVLRSSTAVVSGTCGSTWSPPTPVTLVGGADTSVQTRVCYRYQQRVADNVGNVGTSVFSDPVRVDTRPRIASVTLSGTSAGSLNRGDTITVVFSETMRASTLCSGWSSNTTPYLIDGNNAVTVTVRNGAPGANDVLEVTGAAGCGSPLGFGSLDLGSSSIVGSNVTYSGPGNNASSLSWAAATNTLTIRLGAYNGPGAEPVWPAGTVTRYTNDLVRDLDAESLANSPFTASGRF